MRLAGAIATRFNLHSMIILIRSFEDRGQTWYRALVRDGEDTLFQTGVSTDRNAITEKAKDWCKENGFHFNITTEVP